MTEKAPWALWLDAARAADLKRYKERAAPVVAGGTLTLAAGAPALGFYPVDYDAAFSYRWIGPDPKALIFFGKREAKVNEVTLVLAGEPPAGIGAIRLFWNEAALTAAPAPAPQVRAAHPRAAALRARLPAGAGDRDLSVLGIRLERTVAEPGQAAPTRLVGLALHAVVFGSAA